MKTKMELRDEQLSNDTKHYIKLIKIYDQLLKHALRLNLCYNDTIVDVAHNARSFFINKIEQDSDDVLLVKVWKDGSVHVYNRAEYCKKMYGSKV